MSLYFFYTIVQKSQKWPKTQIKGGPALSSGYLSILSFWRKWALGAPTNRFPLVWEKSSNGKWLKTAFEKMPTYRYFARKCSWHNTVKPALSDRPRYKKKWSL